MTKHDFFKILCTYTPEELNKLISSKGKQKPVHFIVFDESQEFDKKDKKVQKCNESKK